MRPFKDRDLQDALVVFIYLCGGTIRAKQCYGPLATFFHLTENELDECYGNRSAWNIRLQAIREENADEFIFRPNDYVRGYWKLADNGMAEGEKRFNGYGQTAQSSLKTLALPIKEQWEEPFGL